ncbi:low-specificity L-threonine aldolase [Bacillus sp. FJAT-45350]|uniref:low-specificity L-threonine aldolase n=1 Tax=Bacillus sp. FJAT-45350 TaxID=2011014 RepID=UPI000BB80F42|nr:low-specificity L-threonine aldolase [Bacillus sp. FJAT-45350]
MIDLRSDTVTKPTTEMRQAMFSAEVGDDVYREDPTIIKLEETAAQLLGKESALFVTSGTQGNQLAVLAHCDPGQEIIIDEDAHIVYYEGAAISALAGVQPRTIKGNRGAIDPIKLKEMIRPNDIHFPETGLICIENTHNRGGGAVVPLSSMEAMYQVAVEHQVPLHLDGARLFNAAVACNQPISAFADYTDTVQVCLSKGLAAPVGSLLAGSNAFIEKARKWRKRLGGGWRQAGVLAAPGLIALTTMVDRLSEDHENAQRLANGFANIDGLSIENKVETNIVLVNVEQTTLTAEQFLSELKENGILAVAFGPYTIRFTTHYHIGKNEIDTAISNVANIIKNHK